MEGKVQHILLISHDKGFDSKLIDLLHNSEGDEFEVNQVFPLEKALGEINAGEYALVILDLPAGEDCTSATEIVCSAVKHLPLIVLTQFGNQFAVRALKKSAQHVVNKTYLDDQFLLHAILSSIDRKTVENELRMRDEILQAVNHAAEIFLTQSNWDAHLSDVLSSLGQATNSERVYLFRNIEDDRKKITAHFRAEWVADGVQPQYDFSNKQGEDIQIEGYQRWMKLLANGQIINGDVEDLPPDEQPSLMKIGVRSFIVIPIFIDHTWWGFIGFDQCSHQKEWSKVEIDALKTAASILGAAISRQATEEKLTYLATHDYLTNLPNRLLFEDRFHQVVARSQRSGDKFAVISIDLDKFKNVNDSFGHPLGDKVLIEVAKRLESAIRGSDTCARIGGDEFAVIAESIHNKSDVLRVMEKLSNSLKDDILMDGKNIKASASMGASIFPLHGSGMDELLKAADKALYMVKGTASGFRVFSDDQISWLKE